MTDDHYRPTLDMQVRIKRALDCTIAISALVLLAPILLLVAIAIRVRMGSPIMFRQERLGQHGQVFVIHKFRSMTQADRVPDQEILSGHPDVPALGRLLRRLKIDELPQLWNIAKGDMSIVGPRPALPRDLNLYDSRSRRRLEVRPGLTGLAQINGNTRLTWPERWELDVQYVESWSLLLDLRIILKTVAVVLFGEARYAKEEGRG